jgi:hypothetical protein
MASRRGLEPLTPGLRKRGFRVLKECTAVQVRSRGFTGMHKTGARRFLNGEELACTAVNWSEFA